MGKKLVLFITSTLTLLYSYTLVLADEEKCGNPGGLSDTVTISQCIDSYSKTLEAISKANSNNRQALGGLQKQISNLKLQIANLEGRLGELAQDIFDREVKMGVRKELFYERVRRDYVRKREQPLLRVMFTSQAATEFFKNLSYREMLAGQDQAIISDVGREIAGLSAQSSVLSAQKKNLAGLRDRVDKQAGFLAGEVAKADSYVSDLAGKISALNAQQQKLLAEKSGVFATSVGDVPLSDDPNSRPNYNPGFSPAYAAFSFGAPHFNGLSQYGAYGRAKVGGQNAETILRSYYGDVEIKKDYSQGVSICVGYSRANCANVLLETYAKRIYEMPSSWGDDGGMEALKAQAVAARSYALSSMARNGYICPTESCQVYKPQNKGGKWDEAVNATAGWVLVKNGKPFMAKFASTAGGYIDPYTDSYSGYTTSGFWDTTSDWTHWADGAYEVKGGSPWFYKGWYKSRSGSTCGRNHPWLNKEEFADMVNAALVYAGGGDVSGMFAEDVRSCRGGSGAPWSRARMAEEASKFGGAVSSIDSVRVEHGSNGVTKSVILQTNRGEVRIDGQRFQTAFNLRSPGQLSLKSGLFNIEKK